MDTAQQLRQTVATFCVGPPLFSRAGSTLQLARCLHGGGHNLGYPIYAEEYASYAAWSLQADIKGLAISHSLALTLTSRDYQTFEAFTGFCPNKTGLSYSGELPVIDNSLTI